MNDDSSIFNQIMRPEPNREICVLGPKGTRYLNLIQKKLKYIS